MLVKKEEIFFKIQTDESTPAVPVTSDAILVEDLSYSYAGVKKAEYNPRKATLGKEQSTFAGSLIEISFSVKVKGSGTAGTAPEFGDALICCGMTETITASTSVAYTPASTSHKYATIYYYKDGKLQKATGCVGTWELSGTTGESGTLSFTFTGHDAGHIDAALVGGTYDATVPPAIIGAAFTVGAYSPVISALQFSIGNEISTPPDMNSDDGYSTVIINDRDVTGSFDPEDTLVATQNWVGDWKGGVNKAISTGDIGTTAGNKWSLNMPTTYYQEVSSGDRDGLRTLDIPFSALGDDEAFTLTFK